MVRIINIDTKTRTVRVSNGKDDLEWFTTDTGSHVPLKKGQSKAEAIKEHFGGKNVGGNLAAKKAQLHSDFKSGKITQKQLEDGLNKLAVGPSSKDKTAVARDRKEREEIFKAQKETDKSWQKQQPAKPDTSNADYFKLTMQETMKKFPRLYEHEQKHLEEYAVSAFSALRNNPGKEKAIVDEILDSYNQHVKRLGMWVDTPTLAKKAFVEKLAEAYK